MHSNKRNCMIIEPTYERSAISKRTGVVRTPWGRDAKPGMEFVGSPRILGEEHKEPHLHPSTLRRHSCRQATARLMRRTAQCSQPPPRCAAYPCNVQQPHPVRAGAVAENSLHSHSARIKIANLDGSALSITHQPPPALRYYIVRVTQPLPREKGHPEPALFDVITLCLHHVRLVPPVFLASGHQSICPQPQRQTFEGPRRPGALHPRNPDWPHLAF